MKNLKRTQSFLSADSVGLCRVTKLATDILQANENWKWYPAAANGYKHYICSLTVDSELNVYICGVNSDQTDKSGDVWSAKLDQYGNLLWMRSFDFQGASDFSSAIAIAQGGGIFIAGAGKMSIEKGNYNAWLLRLDQNGALLWSKSFGEDPKRFSEFSCVQALPDGGAMLLYEHADTQQVPRVGILRVDASGAKLLESSSPTASNRMANCMQWHDGGILYLTRGQQLLLNKININGNSIWTMSHNLYTSPFIHINLCLTVDRTNNIFICASIQPQEKIEYQKSIARILKLDTSGSILWERTYAVENSNIIIESLFVDASNVVWGIGRKDDAPWLFSIKQNNGSILSERIPQDINWPHQLIVSSTGRSFIAGYSVDRSDCIVSYKLL